jgi:hypothetical protein
MVLLKQGLKEDLIEAAAAFSLQRLNSVSTASREV